MIEALDSCEICGSTCADILCVRCLRTVCERCYSESLDMCKQCAPKEYVVTNRKGLSTAGLRLLAICLISLGVAISSLSTYVGVDGAGLSMAPPTIFEGSQFAALGYYTATILMFFICSSVLPWYMISRKSRSFNEFPVSKNRDRLWQIDRESLEYIITTELPRELAKSIYIEAEDDEVYLMSTKDLDFFRSYSVPHGFEVGEISYDYEGNYLIMKLNLKRNN